MSRGGKGEIEEKLENYVKECFGELEKFDSTDSITRKEASKLL